MDKDDGYRVVEALVNLHLVKQTLFLWTRHT